ncbi:endoglycoceramidase-like [Halichondria panicea]|uniref:endoglycoceramidase-like n=1 Tax=Halichondria panicea TaxID=6063 RepID=UPI00312B5905
MITMITKGLSAVVLLFVFTSTRVLASPDILQVNTTTHRIIDGTGRERYFHGANVVVKGPPWIPRTDKFDPYWSFCEEDMKLLQSWGLNAIRYGMMWPGVEPENGQYNDTYLAASRDIINKAGEYGIHTILDMHQDVLSEKFCGEGIPDWAVDVGNAKDFPFPLDTPYTYDKEAGYPTTEDCAKHDWSSYQVAHATGAAYQALYNNSNGLADKMAAFWGRVAQEFADNEYVLGYELINEPWAGDIYENPELLVPTEADKINLAPFYEILNPMIRKYDDKHSVYFTSVTWDETRVGFSQVPGGHEYQNRSVLAWHFYIPPQLNDAITFYERQKDIEKLGCAGFVTEFRLGDKTTLAKADEYLISWTGWDYKAYVPITGSSNGFWNGVNGTLNTDLVKTMSRTYAQAVAGVAMEMKFDPDSLKFSLKYTITDACSSTVTEIYLNEDIHYQMGYTVTLETSDKDGGGVMWSSPKHNTVQVQHDPTLPHGSIVTVTIEAKS